MKRLLTILLFLGGACYAGEPTKPAMTGPDKTDAYQVTWLDITGEPAFDATKPVADNLTTLQQWLAATKLLVSAPDGAKPEFSPDVQIKFGFAEAVLAWDARVKFVGDKSGVYVVVATVSDQLLMHRLEVGAVPPHDPAPTSPQPSTPGKVNQVTMVYEKDDSSVPRQVSYALRQLNEQGILATEFEEDTVNSAGQVPTQYRIAKEAAQKAGLPALIVQAGEAVVRVVKNPTTEQQVLEAIKP